MHIALTVIAAVDQVASSGPSLQSSAVVEWVVKNCVPLILMVIGLSIVANARKGRMSENAGALSNVLVGLAVIAGGAVLYGFSGQLVDLAFGGS